ncbi:putative transcription factor bHLH family [Lupinus albus]|uniref:Putative transcription factor bHLH family n=1 Tax=Lupinus albus TaxID=3870 RepID=A0A6A4Q1B7_LUPAL|nr:putative transcription factor bHLH family [Lupinus albus]
MKVMSANKSSIIDETISYIESLKQTLEKLEKEKKERLQSLFTYEVHPSIINSSQWYPNDSTIANGNSNTSSSTIPSSPTKLVAFETWSSPNLVLNICGNEAQFCIFATRKPNILTNIALVLEKHKIDVISASILSNGHGNQYTILAHVSFQLSLLLNHFLICDLKALI